MQQFEFRNLFQFFDSVNISIGIVINISISIVSICVSINKITLLFLLSTMNLEPATYN